MCILCNPPTLSSPMTSHALLLSIVSCIHDRLVRMENQPRLKFSTLGADTPTCPECNCRGGHLIGCSLMAADPAYAGLSGDKP